MNSAIETPYVWLNALALSAEVNRLQIEIGEYTSIKESSFTVSPVGWYVHKVIRNVEVTYTLQYFKNKKCVGAIRYRSKDGFGYRVEQAVKVINQ